MKIIRLFLILLAVNTYLNAMDVEPAGIQSLRRDFLSIHQVSQNVLKICPPDRCVIVGIGQSPTPFIAYLRNEVDQYAYAVPLSNFSHGVYHEALNKDQEARLFAHFSSFLPGQAQLGGRSIMLLDYASSSGGKSILAASRYMERYLAQRFNQPPRVEVAVIKGNIDIEKVPYRFNHIFLFELNDPLLQNIENNHYEPYSPYGMFHVCDFEEIAHTHMRREFVELSNQLRTFKSQLDVTKGTLQEPSFKLIQQPGTLDFTLNDIKNERDLKWYAHQLYVYQGSDSDQRFDQFFALPQGKQALIKEWQLFILEPKKQKKLLDEIVAVNNLELLNDIANNFDRVAEDLDVDIIKVLVSLGHDQLTQKLMIKVPELKKDLFIDIFDDLREDARFQQIAEAMLDNFLMPDLVISDEDYSTQFDWALNGFVQLLEDPQDRDLAIRKYQEYMQQKTHLPRVYRADPTTDARTPVVGVQHNQVRALILSKIEELLSRS
ncbi:MAG TPA: hypothetical protein VEL47_06875 [Myxococcota bacterium]|nr:hypothetical protein [Myxococcota bacterium]